MNKLLKRLRGDDAEQGVALAMVIGVGMVITLLVATMMTSSVGGLLKSDGDADSNAALAAAYAGIEDYQSKLANDNTYQQYGNSDALFSAGSAFPGKLNGNPAFGVGKSGSWAYVPNSNNRAKYRYEVDNSNYYNTGIIRLRSTGVVGSQVRTEVADLKQTGFINYLYFTDYEIADPAVTSSRCVPTYDWQTPHSSSCTELQFAPNDDIQGPVHSNDTLLICGSTFESTVETGLKVTGNATPYSVPTTGSCGTPTFSYKPGYKPVYSLPIAMPPTNQQMIQETRSDLTSTTVPRPGCLFTGPTSITFNDGGTMTVKSPWTKDTNITADSSGTVNGGSVSATCGTPGTGAGQLGSAAGQTINVPDNNLIFVQSVPRSNTSDPNYWATGTNPYPTASACKSADGKTAGNSVGYPAAGETAPSTTSYACDTGDVFVKGTVQGKVTVAADNYVYVTGDVKYSTTNSATNILGLVGNNAVWVYNPVDSKGNNLDTSTTGITIDAAILSVAHTFTVQNYTAAYKGNLTVYGSIAQKYRGAVGSVTYTTNFLGQITGSTYHGYTKKYLYDGRLRYSAPPKFLSPVSTSYGVTTLVETKAAFTADGTQVPN